MVKMTNRQALKIALVRNGMSMQKLADEMNITSTTLSYKINGKRQFNQSEIKAIANILDLSLEEIGTIFFGIGAESCSTK